jgi:hypothetical protein
LTLFRYTRHPRFWAWDPLPRVPSPRDLCTAKDDGVTAIRVANRWRYHQRQRKGPPGSFAAEGQPITSGSWRFSSPWCLLPKVLDFLSISLEQGAASSGGKPCSNRSARLRSWPAMWSSLLDRVKGSLMGFPSTTPASRRITADVKLRYSSAGATLQPSVFDLLSPSSVRAAEMQRAAIRRTRRTSNQSGTKNVCCSPEQSAATKEKRDASESPCHSSYISNVRNIACIRADDAAEQAKPGERRQSAAAIRRRNLWSSRRRAHCSQYCRPKAILIRQQLGWRYRCGGPWHAGKAWHRGRPDTAEACVAIALRAAAGAGTLVILAGGRAKWAASTTPPEQQVTVEPEGHPEGLATSQSSQSTIQRSSLRITPPPRATSALGRGAVMSVSRKTRLSDKTSSISCPLRAKKKDADGDSAKFA